MMRIGMIAPPFYAVPPLGYGAVQIHIHHLVTGLQQAGHEVYLFSSGDSACRATHNGYFYRVATDTPSGKTVPELVQVLAGYRAMAAPGVCLDIIHDHTFIGPHMSPSLTRIPVVTTFHDVGDHQRQIIYGGLPEDVGTISISDHQRTTLIGVRTDRRIYPGLSASQYETSENKEYLLFVGRFSPEKGAETAIEVARRANLPIILAGRVLRGQEEYFEERVKPLFSNNVMYIGEFSAEEKINLLAGAIALINPIKYDEPYGLINAEALLSGVPVISYRLGALPEIINHGRNGFLCDNIDDMIRAVDSLDTLDIDDIRRDAIQRFSVERMVSEHIEFYEQMKNRT